MMFLVVHLDEILRYFVRANTTHSSVVLLHLGLLGVATAEMQGVAGVHGERAKFKPKHLNT